MEKISKIYFPSLGITFTGAILFCCFYNLLTGNSFLSIYFLLQLFGFFILAELLDMILGKVSFKSYLGYFLTEAVLIYVLLLVIGYFGYWYSFTFQSLGSITLYYILAIAFIHYHFYRVSKLNADEINRLLKERDAAK